MSEERVDWKRNLNIPNALSLLRALGIPIFALLFLKNENHLLSFLVLAVASATDYLDGKLARLLNQESKLGALLDPAIDRLYILSILIIFLVRDVLPAWLIILILLRDLLLLIPTLFLLARKRPLLEVTYLGKAATFNLLYSMPLFILASAHGPGRIALIFGWAFIGWGVPLYLMTGLDYCYSAFRSIKT